jgi:hypothetical protein
MILKTTYTHKGWFFLCPVYLNASEGDGMAVTARKSWLDGWFRMNLDFFDLVASFSHNEEPFPFKVTGRLAKPFVRESEVD